GLAGFLREHGDWVRETGCRFAVVHGDPSNPRLPEIITRLAAALNDGFLVGGLTSARETHVQVAGAVTSGGLSGVLFTPEVAVATHLTQSCLPFGEAHEITECEGSVVATLDHRPALDVFSEEVGEILSRDLRQAARYIGAALPVAGSDTADYLVRNLVGFDPRRRLLAIGEDLHPGQAVRFCRRDPVGARGDMARMLADLKARSGTAPRGGLYFSCVGRGRHLFGEDSEELVAIEREFPGLPLAGFFCSGEISFNRLYGYTGVLTLFL
ncbi:MAG TPA: FIST C-terminal domain-containing protein, partial [Burkholderiales bacterium]